MTRVGRRFVPQSTIERRVQATDDRYAADLRRRQRHPLDEPVVVPVVVEVALVPKEPDNNGIVIDVALVPVKVSAPPENSTREIRKRLVKPSRVTRAIAQTAARTLDRRKLVAWAVAVKTRDQWRDRRTGTRLLRTLNLDPRRAEAHHLVSRDVRAVRYDVRNGITLSLVTHDAVERGLLRIEGSAWFTVGGVTYIDATAPVRFVRG